MRFEIGPGGGFVILVGLLGLSAAVFFLGMISGREMAQSEQSQSQLATVYPMPAGAPAIPAVAPAAQADVPTAPPPAAPVAAATPRPSSRTGVASENIPSAALPKPPSAQKAPPRSTLASVPPAHRPAPAAEESDTYSSAPSNEADTGTDEGTASAPPPSVGTRHKGYNIVIDAAMDRAAANRMASRLLGLGYTSHIVPSNLNGQIWYRVQVGPYPTSEEARAAQSQLRAAYTARYINRVGAGGTAAATGAGPTSTDASDSGTDDTGSDDSGGGNAAPSD
jgi:cell division septation protein DedD